MIITLLEYKGVDKVINLVDLPRQFGKIKREMMREIKQVIDRGQYIMGPKVSELEESIAKRLNTKHAIGVGNGTDALVLALSALGIGPGDEVITTPFTFFATAEAISQVGATPVFADIEHDTYNINPNEVARKITRQTKAILPVHLFGQPAAMDELIAIAKQHNLYVIEDACQAFGAQYKDQSVGAIGDVGCFSFFPTKNLSTLGDGGLIVTSDDQIAAKVRILRHHGSVKKYYHQAIGYNSRLDELHAAILLVGLKYIDEWNNTRRQIAAKYRLALQDNKAWTIHHVQQNMDHVYHLFCLECDRRNDLAQWLSQKKIQTGVYYPLPLHLQNVYKSLGYHHGDFPVSERVAEKILAIPLSPYLRTKEQAQVIDALLQFGANNNAD